MIHLPARVITNLHAQQVNVTEGAFPTGTRETYELKTVGGYSVKLTADHKVWTRTRGWVEAQNLQPDDEVRLPSKPACVTEIGEPQDPRFFELLGMLVSETNGDVNCLRLDTCLNDADAVEEYSQYVTNHWGERAYDDDYANEAMLGRTEDRESNGDTLTATLTNRRLISRLRAFVRSDASHATAHERRLSDEAFTAGLAAQKHLLRALFSADATITNGTLELQSQSLGFLEDVQLILLGFGVQTAIQTDAVTRGHGDAGTSGFRVPFGSEPQGRRQGSAESEISNLKSEILNPKSQISSSTQHSALSTQHYSPSTNDGGAVAREGMPDRPAHFYGPPNGGDDSRATACVSIRAAFALLESTSASCRAKSSSSSPPPSASPSHAPKPAATSTASPRLRHSARARSSTSPSRGPAPSSPTG
ncbi:MAG: ribonucleoside-diphosphate reductase alpha chain, partial [Phycisphaerales bacterium]|nr:ribonucleoside-diphosphate reductase alpha chain [Phycisphaerales bacterium]